jgi:hypothetical protein
MSRRASPHGGFLFYAVILTVEIAGVLVRLNHVASSIVNANHRRVKYWEIIADNLSKAVGVGVRFRDLFQRANDPDCRRTSRRHHSAAMQPATDYPSQLMPCQPSMVFELQRILEKAGTHLPHHFPDRSGRHSEERGGDETRRG